MVNKYLYTIRYNDRHQINHGILGVTKEKQLEEAMNTALARIGASTLYSRFSFDNRSYTVESLQYKYQGVFTLCDKKGNPIKLPEKLHKKLIK